MNINSIRIKRMTVAEMIAVENGKFGKTTRWMKEVKKSGGGGRF